MRKVFVGTMISLLTTFAAASVDLTILTKVEQTDHKWIKPCITIKNNSLTNNIQLQGKIVKYYFYATNLDYTALQFATWYCPVSGVTIRVIPYTPEYTGGAKKANFVFEMKFTQSTIINKNSTLGEFKYGFHMPDWRVFYEDDDWSYSPTTNYTLNPYVPIFDGTTLYWGNPPPSGPVLTRIELAPPSATVNVSDIKTFFATGYDQNNNIIFPVPSLVWSATGDGTIDNTGLFTAGATAGTATVKATSGSVSQTAPVTVVATGPLLTTIVVSPSSATVYFLDHKQFTAIGYDQNGQRLSSQPTFTWSLSTTTQAFINSTTGMFSASMSTGTWVVTATSGSVSGTASISVADRMALLQAAKDNIKHVIIIMQENRSFDNYFGKYKPGNNQKIDTIPSGISCVYNGITYSPAHYTNSNEADYGHQYSNAKADTTGSGTSMYLQPLYFLQTSSATASQASEIIGFHDNTEIPSYWALADNYVLQDHMFEPAPSWSAVAHLYLFSEWSATAGITDISDWGPAGAAPYSWNSLANLLDQYLTHSWKVYQGMGWSRGTNCDKSNFADNRNEIWPPIWNPLKDFSDVASTYTYANVYDFFQQMNSDPTALPKVSWIVPNSDVSEHPNQSNLKDGHAYVVSIINGIMSTAKLWDSCAIFLSWDDWGGFYDHVIPPKTTDGYGYGLRVPGLMISPYAKKGFVDNQILSHDAYAKFIEDLFINGTRISASDNRPVQRETESVLGDLLYEFDFTQTQPTLNLGCGPTPP